MLDEEASKLYSKIQSEFGVRDAAGMAVLKMACESEQLARICREQIDADGLLTATRRPHPLFSVQKAARASFLACIKNLGLDLEGAGAVGAPIGNTNRSNLKRVK